MPTSYGASPIKEAFGELDRVPVWPLAEGTARGPSVEPIYSTAPFAAQRDEDLYRLLVAVDAVRVGCARRGGGPGIPRVLLRGRPMIRTPAVDRIVVVAKALEGIPEPSLFVGASVLGLLATQSAAPTPRPTEDVDLVVLVTD